MKTKDDAIAALRTIVKGKEQFEYREENLGCQYVTHDSNDDWAPSCGVGWVLMKLWGVAPVHLSNQGDVVDLFGKYSPDHIDLDFSVEQLANLELRTKHPDDIPHVPIRLTDDALRVLLAFQMTQDGIGKTWGDALERAEKVWTLLRSARVPAAVS